MKKLCLPFLAVLACLTSSAQLQQVTHELYGTRSTGEEVYRIFALLEDPTDFVSSVYAAGNDALHIGSDVGGIVNDEFGGTTGDQINVAFCTLVADVCLDSYVTIGYTGVDEGNGLYYDGSIMGSSSPVTAISTSPPGTPIADSFLPANGVNLDLIDGAWFSPNIDGANAQGFPTGPDNKVLLAQVAIPIGGSLEYGLNLQIFDEGVGNNEYFYVWNEDTADSGDTNGWDLGCVYPYGNCIDVVACNYNDFPGESPSPAACDYSCYGCTDTTACNYSPEAIYDDGSCSTNTGCTDENAANYDSTAACDDGSCQYTGCTSSTACNYNSAADVDDGSCVEPDGCTNEAADNYDSTALCDDGSCLISGCTTSAACNYNVDANSDDGSCILPDGCTDPGADNYDAGATCDDGSCLYPGNTFLTFETVAIHDGVTDDGEDLTGFKTYRMYVNLPSGDDFLSSVYGVDDQILDVSTTTSFWQSPFGSANADDINPLFFDVIESVEFDSWVTIGKENMNSPGQPIFVSDGPSNWISTFEGGGNIYVSDNIGASWFTVNLGPEESVNGYGGDDMKVLVGQFTTDGQIDACIHVQVFPNGVGSDFYTEMICASSGPIEGCTNSTSCNYSPLAEIDDGSCTDTCPGCTDTLAQNYNSNATEEDGSCLYPGCTDSSATNYNSTANLDDGSCEFPGCTDPLAINFDSVANVDDGSCDYDCDENALFLVMTDTFGDGWNGATWSLSDELGNQIESGTLDTAPSGDGSSTGTDLMCVPDGCYTFDVGGGQFDSEINWTIALDGDIIESGSAPYSLPLDLNGSCVIGCMDPGSCNYDSSATLNYGCDYYCIGCTDSTACNYEADNTMDNGSCQYYAIIEGFVYNDTDQNGQYTPGPLSDVGLPNWAVTLVELGTTVFTSNDGYFQFFNVPAGTYTLEITSVADGWTNSTPTLITVTTADCITSNQNFGFYATGASPFYVSGPCCIWMMDIHCEDGFNPGLWIHNIGSVPLNGSITITFDPVLEAELFDNWGEIIDPDEINPGEVIWNLDDSPDAGQQGTFQCHIVGPGVDYIGDQFDVNINLTLVDEVGDDYYNNDWLLQPIVVCSYDPNDKYTAFEGYTDEHHFVLKENEMEYRIRFQNEGNWPAEDIVIKDTLDIDLLDLDSFYPAFGSHSFMTCVHPDGAVEFVFEDINLPDIENNPEGSQGYVVYRVTPRDDVDPGDVINNTAHILFDSNPAIVTNTTWHTIYECGEEAAFDVTSPVCVEDEISADATHEFVDDYLWTYNGDEVGVEESWSDIATQEGAVEVTLTASNLLCEPITLSQFVNVNPVPDASFTTDGTTLNASNGDAWQWYLDGVLIDGATEQVYVAESTGMYAVEVFNEWNCSTISDEQSIVTSIGELLPFNVALQPNPMIESSTLYWSENREPFDLKIYDARGQLVWDEKNINSSSYTIDGTLLSAGYYTVRLAQDHQSSDLKLIVQ